MTHHPDPRTALRSPWHLAVVAGPDTGWCLGLGPEPAEVGRGAADLPLTDPLVSRRHLEVRERRGRFEARDHGSANGTRWRAPSRLGRRRTHPSRARPQPRVLLSLTRRLPPALSRALLRARTRPLPPRWRELPEGTNLRLGATVLQVRRRPEDLRAPAAPEPSRAPEGRDWVRMALPLLACLTMVPLLVSSGAGPWRWAILAVPVVLLAATVVAVRRPRAPELPDPAALLLHAAAAVARLPAGEELRATVSASRPGAGLVLGDGDRVALVGRPGHVTAAAWWLACQLATWHGDLRVDLPSLPGGGPRRLGPAGAPRRLTVLVAPGPADAPRSADPSRTADTPAEGPPATGDAQASVHVVLARSVQEVPAWCTRVVTVDRPGISPAWAAAAAGLLARGATASTTALPRQVHLADLLGEGPADDPAVVRRQWAVPHPGLAAPLGVDEAGTVEIDLVVHGPHALLAGTTGSGKSELLLAWLLALALRHPPDRLQLVLVDYKGGATFAGLAGLPHTAGVLTDLEPAATVRALASLRAEVRRRERLLADAGAKDLAAYLAARPAEPLPRLVVVVDEFRALADSHPDLLDALVRLAAQGRSLGIHLVLATQRPGGAVSADVRANLTVRICLRVLEAAESQDVVGTSGAADLPPVPGRALVRTDTLRTVQAPWCGDDGWAGRAVRAAREAWESAWDSAGAEVREVPGRPWAPALPRRVELAGLEADAAGPAGPDSARPSRPHADGAGTADPRSGLVLGVSDLPDEQRLGVWVWRPSALLVVGGPGTGRTETLRSVVASALRARAVVHVLAAGPHRFADLAGPTLGTVTGSDDPRRAARLLERLEAETAPQLLVVDDAEAVAERLDQVAGPGQGLQLLARALRDGRRAGVATALSGPPSLLAARWTESVRTRVVLAPRDETEALLAGVPRDLHGGDPVPGRGVLLEPGRATAVQVAVTGAVDLGPAEPGILRVAPLPERVSLAELSRDGLPPGELPPGEPVPDEVPQAEPPHGATVLLGRGGDDGGPVGLRCEPGEVLLVVGPPGSGRTTTLSLLRQQLGGRAVAVGQPGDLPAGPAVLVVDDVDRWASPALEELGQRLASRRDLVVVAAARPEPVVGAYRGPLATWRSTATLLLLRPSHPATTQLTDVDLSTAADPARPLHPGRGVLVTRGRALALQVATPADAPAPPAPALQTTALQTTAPGARVPEA
ncbi:S-DNA-T family DNA segregation ATPase FtsK/SpoIIIE [Georgenia soli]|uniref:S-DNA-T family DNA segregation ATPase FtsK/SpoIIIE n=1 Tax=Georgenia soli TaxID=638953 RepID=A0A2A9ER68_9MICO|nr:FtsK/SpoIIIE domain-containing protein [Georgenia soli]PFG40762.1 S-DNA-T family DNA segregation ATPase FtsK/SpoIIIE [Georgenia soli]